MTRRTFSAALLLLTLLATLPAAARPAEKVTPLEVTYYYLPG